MHTHIHKFIQINIHTYMYIHMLEIESVFVSFVLFVSFFLVGGWGEVACLIRSMGNGHVWCFFAMQI